MIRLAAVSLGILISLSFCLLFSCASGGGSSSDDDQSSDDSDDSSSDDSSDDDSAMIDDSSDDSGSDDDTFVPGTDFVVMVPMRDAVKLRTKVFLPDHITHTGAPTVMTRTPYRSDQGNAEYEKRANVFVDKGYVFVLQDCRGRNESEGVFTPYTDENLDAIDTCEWIADQSWSNGEVGTLGASYDAYTALVAAADNPRVKVVLAEEPPENESGPHKSGGTVSKGRLEWLYTMKNGEWMNDDEIALTTNMLDVADADFTVLGEHYQYWADMVANPDPSDPVWTERAIDPYWPSICAPVLTLYAMELQWNDPILNWNGLRGEGCAEQVDDQRLMVVPEKHGYHTFMLPYLETQPNKLMLQYVDKFLGHEDIDLITVEPVQYRSVDDLWYWVSETWPPQVVTTTYHLDSNGGAGYLRDGSPTVATPESIMLDPATTDPCDDAYPKILFTSDVLASGTYIAGTPTADIYVSTTTPDADLFLDLKEYPLLGEPRLISCTQTRLRYRDGGDDLLAPGEIVHLVLDMFPVAFTVKSGARIGLEARPAHCGFFENPHTGEELAVQTHWDPSTLTIYHDGDHLSHITLPIKQ